MRIVVDCDGEIVRYEDGDFFIPNHLQGVARQHLILGIKQMIVQPDGEEFTVGVKNPVEILALFYSLAPGRSYLLEGPEELQKMFDPEE